MAYLHRGINGSDRQNDYSMAIPDPERGTREGPSPEEKTKVGVKKEKLKGKTDLIENE
jgi:hypothetical protein